jgi:hypothetical protein
MNLIFKLFKLCLFTFNTFYFLIGISLVIGSIFFYLNPNQINDLLKLEYGSEYLRLVYALNGFGAFLVLVGFIGCASLICQRICLLFAYFSLLFLIFTMQFAASIYLYTKSVGYFKQFKGLIELAIKYEYGESSVHTRAVDYLQSNFKCCGWHSPKDWFESNYVDPKHTFKTSEHVITLAPSYVHKIPYSCCVNNYDLTCVLMHKFHEVGCETVLKYYYSSVELHVAWSIAFLNVFQLILLILSLYLLCMMFFDSSSDNFQFRKKFLTAKFEQHKRKRGDGRQKNDNSSELDDEIDDDPFYMTSYYL